MTEESPQIPQQATKKTSIPQQATKKKEKDFNTPLP
jgi:hypothetical protein